MFRYVLPLSLMQFRLLKFACDVYRKFMICKSKSIFVLILPKAMALCDTIPFAFTFQIRTWRDSMPKTLEGAGLETGRRFQ